VFEGVITRSKGFGVLRRPKIGNITPRDRTGGEQLRITWRRKKAVGSRVTVGEEFNPGVLPALSTKS